MFLLTCLVLRIADIRNDARGCLLADLQSRENISLTGQGLGHQVGCVRTETCGFSLTVYDLYPPASGAGVGISAWICVFGVAQLLISLLKNFNSLRGISFLAAVMSLGYSTTAFALTIKNGK
jgi:hypothetical protein